jgi:hypothetical protein
MGKPMTVLEGFALEGSLGRGENNADRRFVGPLETCVTQAFASSLVKLE